jgi:HlyD family secretion protein
MKLTKWHIIGAVVLVVLFIVVYSYWKGGSSQAGEPEIRYKEFTVRKGTFRSSVSASGIVIPIDRVQIKSKASGLIEEMPVEEGDFVKKESLICRLDQTDVKAEVDQAKADLDIAKAELKQAENTYRRQQQLYSKGLLSDEELDQVDLQLAQANGKMVRARILLDQANIRLSETVVLAPIDGIILQKYVEVGQIIASGISNVSGGTPIADIADMNSVYIEAGIDEIDVGKIRVDQIADVITEAYPQREFSGKIIRIAPEARVEQNVTLFDVVIEVENKNALLKSGMNATVEITISEEDDVLLVPTMVLKESCKPGSKRNTRMVLLKEGDKYNPHPVEIGLSEFDYAVVLSGLQEGDTVAVPMTSRLKEENDRLEERIKSTRSFGTSNSSNRPRQ